MIRQSSKWGRSCNWAKTIFILFNNQFTNVSVQTWNLNEEFESWFSIETWLQINLFGLLIVVKSCTLSTALEIFMAQA